MDGASVRMCLAFSSPHLPPPPPHPECPPPLPNPLVSLHNDVEVLFPSTGPCVPLVSHYECPWRQRVVGCALLVAPGVWTKPSLPPCCTWHLTPAGIGLEGRRIPKRAGASNAAAGGPRAAEGARARPHVKCVPTVVAGCLCCCLANGGTGGLTRLARLLRPSETGSSRGAA